MKHNSDTINIMQNKEGVISLNLDLQCNEKNENVVKLDMRNEEGKCYNLSFQCRKVSILQIWVCN